MKDNTLNTQLLLNMQMILDDLEEDFDIAYVCRHHDTQSLADARIYFGQQELDSAYVYVAQAETFEKYPIQNAGICRISVGKSHRQEDPPYSLIEIDGTVSWQEVFSAVQAAFQRYFPGLTGCPIF